MCFLNVCKLHEGRSGSVLFSLCIQYIALCPTPNRYEQASLSRMTGNVGSMAPDALRAEDVVCDEGMGSMLTGLLNLHIQAPVAPGSK